MAIPSQKESRLFYRCAKQRYEEAEILLEAGHPTGAVYLAGYGIECMLKALVLSAVPPGQVDLVLRGFRGNRAHEYEWLRGEYRVRSQASFPKHINQCFSRVDTWSTDLRYEPGNLRMRDAEVFMETARELIRWIDGRL
jgi:HEPN domain-containing protein